MNGISKEDLVGSGSRTPTGRPKTIAATPKPELERRQTEQPPPPQARPKPRETASTYDTKPKQPNNPISPRPGNIPISPKPALVQRPKSQAGDSEPRKTVPKPKDTYMDNVSTGARRPEPKRTDTAIRDAPKPPVKDDDDRRSIKDTAANTAKRRSTITATPKMPPPPPVPESRPKVSKRKSFLSAFRHK